MWNKWVGITGGRAYFGFAVPLEVLDDDGLCVPLRLCVRVTGGEREGV